MIVLPDVVKYIESMSYVPAKVEPSLIVTVMFETKVPSGDPAGVSARSGFKARFIGTEPLVGAEVAGLGLIVSPVVPDIHIRRDSVEEELSMT